MDSNNNKNVSTKSSNSIATVADADPDYNPSSSSTTQTTQPSGNSNINKRLDFLLKQSEIYSHFMATAAVDPESGDAASKSRVKRRKKIGPFNNDDDGDDAAPAMMHRFAQSPDFIDGTMRDYQIRGLNWLVTLHENNINGVLADEMGLGKTLQTISMIGYLLHVKRIRGPHIVIVPKSTLQNWLNEFARFCPTVLAVGLIGTPDERRITKANMLSPTADWNVLVTTYDMCLMEERFIRRFDWHYMVIDEAHRIKNEKTRLATMTRRMTTRHRLLLTGTPLQNNLHELWSLLNFLLPDVFDSAEDFDRWFDTDKLDDHTLLERLHKIMEPFMLRRIKSEVEKSLLPKKECRIYVGLTPLQRTWYMKVLLNEVDAFNPQTGGFSRKKLDMIWVHLRKCTSHPYIFDGAEDGPPFSNGEHIVRNSGKMIVLDKLLAKLYAQGSRVLVFCQMHRMLDILEDYCAMRGYAYHRLDGDTPHAERSANVDEFNANGSRTFLFMLSTRAGGLGINLATADAVIIYDSDWNPQMDLQATDRAHRIGQRKQVHVYRLVTENTLDQRIVERADKKLYLDKLVIQQAKLSGRRGGKGNAKTAAAAALPDQKDMLNIVRLDAQRWLDQPSDGNASLDLDIDELLAAGEARMAQQRQQMLDEMAANGDEPERPFALDMAAATTTAPMAPVPLHMFEGENYQAKRAELKSAQEASAMEALQERRRVVNLKPDAMYLAARGVLADVPSNALVKSANAKSRKSNSSAMKSQENRAASGRGVLAEVSSNTPAASVSAKSRKRTLSAVESPGNGGASLPASISNRRKSVRLSSKNA